MTMKIKDVLCEWMLDMEFNKEASQLTKEGESILNALKKAVNSDIYALSKKELSWINGMASTVLLSGEQSRDEIRRSLLEQNFPVEKIADTVEQTIRVRKEARVVQDKLQDLLK